MQNQRGARKGSSKVALGGAIAIIAFMVSSCNIQTGKSHYILAERLFNDHKYSAAVEEFQKVVESDPQSIVAQQALFRIGLTQYLYLGIYAEAVKSFRQFTFRSQDTDLVYQAEKNIGEIFFTKLEDHKMAIEQYKRLLDKYPDSKEKDFFLFRLAKSNYSILKFDDTIKYYNMILQQYPKSTLREEVFYQIGNTYYTSGNYDAAIEAFEDLLMKHPKSSYVVYAQFGIAGCMEEMDQLEEAYTIYSQIKDKYPSKNIVEIKMKRVLERRKNRNR